MPQYLTGMRKQNTTLPTTTTPSATMMGGGRGASQASQAQADAARLAAQVQAINSQNAARQAAQDIAIKNAIANTSRSVTPTATPVDVTPADISINGGVSGNGGGGTYQPSAAPASNPYADLMAIYQQKLDAENAANEQRRQAQLNALNSRYETAKGRLSDAFNSGETALNNDANKALREAYIQSRLNERNLNQRLQSMGINGGAMESSLARAYNDYGNSRNAIEQNRMDALRELLSQYQGQLGDMESAYSANLADLDSNYFGNGLDFITDYYDAIAALQKENAASNLQAQLGKRSSGNVSAEENSGLNKDIVNGLKNYKGNLAAARAYLTYMGIPEQTQNDYLMNGGFGADLMNDGSLTSIGINPDSKAILDSIDDDIIARFMNYVGGDRGQIYNGDAQLLAAVQRFGNQYGLTEEQVRALLAEASRR